MSSKPVQSKNKVFYKTYRENGQMVIRPYVKRIFLEEKKEFIGIKMDWLTVCNSQWWARRGCFLRTVVGSEGDALSQGGFWFSILQLDKLILLTCLALRTPSKVTCQHAVKRCTHKGLADQESYWWHGEEGPGMGQEDSAQAVWQAV